MTLSVQGEDRHSLTPYLIFFKKKPHFSQASQSRHRSLIMMNGF